MKSGCPTGHHLPASIMARGGHRPGAGRPKGSGQGRNSIIKNKAQRALATVVETTKVMLPDIDREFAELSPQQVMHICMAHNMQMGRYDDAHRCARDLAPYVHARLANINVNNSDEKPIEDMTAEELSALVRQLDIIDAEIIESDAEADPIQTRP